MKKLNDGSNLLIYGGGAWGTALAITYAVSRRVTLMVRSVATAERLAAERENRDKLPGFALPQSLEITAYDAQAVQRADVIIQATPVAAFDESLAVLNSAPADTPIVLACKGLHHSTGELLLDAARNVYADERIWGIFSGPSFAQGLAAGHPTACTIAIPGASSRPLALARFLSAGALRCYATNDVAGVQIGGALKNIYAIAAGAIHGAGWGENTRAALLARGMYEILLFGKAHGASTSTLMGLSGMGDLHLTCSSELSRNFQVGMRLANKQNLSRILAELGHVAEGVATTLIVCRRAREMSIEMPIAEAVNDLINGNLTVQDAVAKLLVRNVRLENDHCMSG